MKTPRECGLYLRWTLKLLSLGVGLVCVVSVLLLLLLFLPGCYDEGKEAVEVSSEGVSCGAYVPEDREEKEVDDSSFSLRNDVYFSSFDGTLVYDNRGSLHGTVARTPFVSERRMFEQVRQDAVGYLKGRGRRGLSRQNCKDIRYRVVAAAGMVVEVICSSSSSSVVDRVVVQLPYSSSHVVHHTHVDETQTLGIVVPLGGRVETLEIFLSNLLQVTRVGAIRVVLTVVYFEDHNTPAVAAALDAARSIGNLQTQLILLRGKFSRARALKTGVEEARGGAEVVFLCDVDVLMTRNFLLRCLASPIRGRQVFFPVFFSEHNPNLTYSTRGEKTPSDPALKPADHHGYWRLWSFGMVCLYKSDFLKIGGFDSRTKGWGGEDLHFVARVRAMNYNVTRSLDYGLFHPYHAKDCTQAGRGQLTSCLRVQALSEASGQTFGLWYFKHQHNVSIRNLIKNEEMLKDAVKIEKTEEQWKKEMTEEAGENEGRASAGIFEDTLILQTTLLAMTVANIVLCAYVVLTRSSRYSSARQPQPEIG